MPPPAAGPNYKRKDANKKKKKKKKNTTKKSLSSSSIQPPPPHSAGEQSDGGQVSSPHPSLNAEKINQDNTIEKTYTPAAQKQAGKIEIDRGSSSQKPHDKNLNSRSSSSSDNQSRVKKKAASSEHATTVADYLCQPIESSSPEKGDHKVEDLDIKTPSIIDQVKTVDQEVTSQLQLNKSTNYLQKENDLVVPKTPLEQTVFNENVLKNNPLSKENEVHKLASDQKDSAQSKNSLLPDSTNVKCPYCGKSSTDDRTVETPECSERQPLLPASAHQVAEKSCWKSCCGIFELFSNSRN